MCATRPKRKPAQRCCVPPQNEQRQRGQSHFRRPSPTTATRRCPGGARTVPAKIGTVPEMRLMAQNVGLLSNPIGFRMGRRKCAAEGTVPFSPTTADHRRPPLRGGARTVARTVARENWDNPCMRPFSLPQQVGVSQHAPRKQLCTYRHQERRNLLVHHNFH